MWAAARGPLRRGAAALLRLPRAAPGLAAPPGPAPARPRLTRRFATAAGDAGPGEAASRPAGKDPRAPAAAKPPKQKPLPLWLLAHRRRVQARKLMDPQYRNHLVKEEEAGTSLQRWVARHYPAVPAPLLAHLCRTRAVYRRSPRGQRRRLTLPTTVLEAGEYVCVPGDLQARLDAVLAKQQKREERRARRLAKHKADVIRAWVLYKDEACIVLNKPPGVPVRGSRPEVLSIEEMLPMLQFDKSTPPLLTHTLDTEASGVLVLGRAPRVAQQLIDHWAQPPQGPPRSLRQHNRVFWAVVQNTVAHQRGLVRVRLEEVPGRDQCRVAEQGGYPALTEYAVNGTAAVAGRPVTWLSLYPHTLLRHQLLAHCSLGLGCPIVGDAKYGEVVGDREAPFPGLHLHCRKVVLPWSAPGAEERLTITAPLPPALLATWQACGWDSDKPEWDVSGRKAVPRMRLAPLPSPRRAGRAREPRDKG